MTSTAHFTSKSMDWATPVALMAQLEEIYGPFTLDPCATAENAKAPTFYTPAENGLTHSWAGHRVYMNPPYGRSIGTWVAKAWYEAYVNGDCDVVCLIPSRTDTRYWHDYVMAADEILFIRNRIYFSDGDGRAPFPSAVVRFVKSERTTPAIGSLVMKR